MRRLLKYAIAFALATPLTAEAQGNFAPNLGNLMFDGDATSNGRVDDHNVGPYKAHIKDFAPTLDNVLTPNFIFVWCVDAAHIAPSTSEWDSYYATALDANSVGNDGDGDYSKTRAFGSAAGTTTQKNTFSDKLYRQAAWLIEQYDPSKDGMYGAGLFNATNIQGTIWNLFGAGITPNASNNFFQLSVAQTVTLTKDWYVLSDKMSSGEQTSNQEFMTYRERPGGFIVTTTPEPSTYALMTAGLFAIGFAARRRRSIAKS